MNYGPLVFLAAFFALASSWVGFVLGPQLQVGRLEQGTNLTTKALYPQGRSGLASQGLEVYRANGCAYCHSQQVRQDGISIEVRLVEVGTNQAKVISSLVTIGAASNESDARALIAKVPVPVLKGVTKVNAAAEVKRLQAAGAKAEIWVVPTGPELERGWGRRRTVAEDFLFDSPAPVGSQRVGPDLANVGLRKPDIKWHLKHLYAPRIEVTDSSMPPYRFLFETRRIGRVPSPDAIELPVQLAPQGGFEVVPSEQAEALAAYLVSLRADTPLFDAPFTEPAAPPASTNAPAGGTLTNAPASGAATNAPKQ